MSETVAATSQPQIDESYSFKWSDYPSHLSGVVCQLLEEECMVDVTLVAAGERIPAHRIVLSSCSTLFQEVLSQATEDHPTIILSDISAQDVRSIVEFSYHGEVRIPVDNISDLLEAAHSLKICGLMEIDGLDENDAIISTKDNLEETVESPTEFNDSDERESEALEDGNNKMTMRKRKPRKEPLKRDYSDEMLASAINDLKFGLTLIEASAKNSIPRSTLYMRAKSLGIQLNASRNQYPTESMKAAMDAVISGLSLQQASEKFCVPKTVLWRRIQKEGYQILRNELRRSYDSDKREAAVQALQRGENLTKVSQEFQIPKTTLFRDKAKLVDEGKLPESFWKKRKTGNDETKRLRLEEAVAACKSGKMSQAGAAVAYRVAKTTIWRKLQQDNKNSEGTGSSKDSEPEESDEKNEQNSEYTLCEVSSEIPITYIDENSMPEDSVIILTTEDVDNLNLEENRQIVVNQESGRDFVRCSLSNEENTEAPDYQSTES